MNPKKRDKILQKAFEIWEAEGKPHGQDMEHWLKAELLIAQEEAKPKTAAKKAPAKKAPAKKVTVSVPATAKAPAKKAPAKKAAAKKTTS
ncbi:DUF2934 domain-containing protein [Magnetovibrio blakemorei]|uniref:DUF2934 domain-containing protein n=1 Tax=Magnetovibrio blakemorei TaxID=28181 RepID=A0A1E5Q598_9PROT|nr:DUF2934 domain-containing protein [Magnetovibrio blakemorei]OEJ65572.1 hypothetical protein BEN30_14035 [Magnetovibrio blakemorei]